ncbi:site-specific integrase [Burkholderia ubonensis]|uniref:hypothetical protein n=1 Tax=Burkholderia ubonensis TaxID=101571 RepID=UPI000755F489|nr:hypothetical protein [Burkholderia ubonensis]KVR17620.1 hypothetical protein WK12_04490 [Burkholderia ubonensis]KWD37201.1 hypothetical protein WL64_19045 [Burkholderia ubonensis]KWD44706.1 hypothetical protein WL63_02255 [Burkholderia ubonensis]KWQ02660.1 hypothetical protein WM35_01520 [Burkholderia ubonensis]
MIRLGFLRYVEEVRAAGHDRLYPHRPFVNGTHSKRLGEKFRKRLDALKITDPRKSFHSFRSNVITAPANNGANTAQTFKQTEHKDRDNANTRLGYVRNLPDLKAIVDRIEWPIHLDALAYDGRFAHFLVSIG